MCGMYVRTDVCIVCIYIHTYLPDMGFLYSNTNIKVFVYLGLNMELHWNIQDSLFTSGHLGLIFFPIIYSNYTTLYSILCIYVPTISFTNKFKYIKNLEIVPYQFVLFSKWGHNAHFFCCKLALYLLASTSMNRLII
jgi:hypothetical protein